ncbi:aminotransferase class III-fold pyridoxal phosphate-dependent enzyme [Ancylobacter sp. 3268]|uniref:aminotransferase class III-fold pyridoxal phosphate-dependent enzyme n=1 Tax=Ancylobacter sp. 3268 TaxID=2817752 RepID=UPI00286C410E|nr:aminotransferase class III-fold pyridoxal phosphate-dependent enzyme [Ancylobacter sp. 3268]
MMIGTASHPASAFVAPRDRVARINEREINVFRQRTRASNALRERALSVMPTAVPSSWMAGYYSHPQLFADHGVGASFFDADGNRYVDMNVSDLSMTVGFGVPEIEEALARQYRKGAHFLLPTEDAIAVAELLSALTGPPAWQFTVSASGANTDIMRIARHMTGRRKLLVFEGKYHGHLEETLVLAQDGVNIPEYQGLSGRRAEDTIILPFNDLDAVRRVLVEREVALALTEPAMTNCTLVMPDPGYLEGLRRLTRETGTMLCIDEAHTFSFAYGGLTREWQLESDFMTLGKGFGSGVAFAGYGMTRDVADHVERHLDILHRRSGIGLGGTLYGSALAMAVARVMLERVLTVSAHDRISTLGARMADGIDAICRDLGLPCRAFRLGPRSGLCLSPDLPRNDIQARASMDLDMLDARRVFMANRGYWDCIVSAGPQASFAHTAENIDGYVAVMAEFMHELVRGEQTSREANRTSN